MEIASGALLLPTLSIDVSKSGKLNGMVARNFELGKPAKRIHSPMQRSKANLRRKWGVQVGNAADQRMELDVKRSAKPPPFRRRAGSQQTPRVTRAMRTELTGELHPHGKIRLVSRLEDDPLE